MQFKELKSRMLTLREANKHDIQVYGQQLRTYKISEGNSKFAFYTEGVHYLAIEKENKKFIGFIRIDVIDETAVKLDISIPNEVWCYKYGKEAIHQFVKYCMNNKIYKTIYFCSNNKTIQDYIKERSELFTRKTYIKIA